MWITVACIPLEILYILCISRFRLTNLCFVNGLSFSTLYLLVNVFLLLRCQKISTILILLSFMYTGVIHMTMPVWMKDELVQTASFLGIRSLSSLLCKQRDREAKQKKNYDKVRGTCPCVRALCEQRNLLNPFFVNNVWKAKIS